jgi:tetratricopeptide (TPR) repeat protein
MGGARSLKQQRERLVGSLRGTGASWVQVADAMRQFYRVNARVAFRYAHGWSQRRAAEEWNTRWPDELKSFKNFSYWESWPGATGHAPSFDNLSKLAELYECAVSDLLVDLPDFRHLDAAGSDPLDDGMKRLVLPDGSTLDGDTAVSTQDGHSEWGALSALIPAPAAAPLVQRLQEVNVTELAQVIVMWMQHLPPSVSRRALLSKLGSAVTLAAVSPLFDVLNPAEYEPVARFVQHPERFDLPALAYVERMIPNLRSQDNVLGSQATLPSVIGYRQMAQQLAQAAPVAFQQRAVSAYADLTQALGWLCFNMGDYRTAQHYYDDARSAAHEAQNVELVAYILCSMSQLATWQGKPCVGIDHAVAAATWAQQANSPLAQAYAADVAVEAYIADDQPDTCRHTLDQEYAALQAVRADEPRAAWWYFYDESFYRTTEGACALKLHRPDAAMHVLDMSLAMMTPTDLHNYTFCSMLRAQARIQQVEIAEAASIVADVAQRTAGSASPRIVQRVRDVRRQLTPWERTQPVRELDELLASYRPAGSSGNSSAKRTYSEQ